MSKHGPKYVRQKSEKYYTPRWVTIALIARERFFGDIIDPACGANDIVKAINNYGFNVCEGRDLHPDDPADLVADFLDTPEIMVNVVTNPPFGNQGLLAMAFIVTALHKTRMRGGKVAMLLPVGFDNAKTRGSVFGLCPQFSGKYILLERIRWANLPQSVHGPMENHAWFVWDWRRDPTQAPFIRYIPAR